MITLGQFAMPQCEYGLLAPVRCIREATIAVDILQEPFAYFCAEHQPSCEIRAVKYQLDLWNGQ